MTFTNLKRNEIIGKMTAETFDILVIGGGITGAGIALDAAARGIKIALLDMQDFSAGTSSRSTKLVHGGLRYLKQLDVKVVAEVGKERAIVYENGPHVTTPEWMLLPFHQGGTFGSFTTSIGLRAYDFLAGVKKSERRTMLTKEETLRKEPLIKKTGLKGGGYYVEYRTDDARLTIEVLKAAVDKGATALNYAKVEELVYENGRVTGVMAVDQLTGAQFAVKAGKVINAAGPWVDSIREKDGSKKGKTLILSKGVHIVIDQSRFPLKQAVYFDTEDGRMVFAIPRNGKTYVGTTDTFYNDDIAHPRMTTTDRDYLLNAINYMFPDVKAKAEDVESSWAGIRPLIHEEGKGPSEISRKDEIWESESGLITIAGGKLTGYRKMAETIVDLVTDKLQAEGKGPFSQCQTKHLPISGGDVGGSDNFGHYIASVTEQGVKAGLQEEDAESLTAFYGSNAPTIFELISAQREEAAKSGLPLTVFAKLAYAIEYEMAATPVDFYFRRTGDLLFDIDSVHEWKDKVLSYMGQKFNWPEAEKEKYAAQLDAEIEGAVNALNV
ncbi:glycerol-3-phosphate dehydrogenase/oxidase [Bacillus sp. T33-2]|uniref:glycerol-3-phosphate dehydrogenase/oxidase n=1 Tax=Bacillus sp. T33-2 TaxID=2054168 RepID=UPI000C769BE1|nr:FAD-dependent oxidoreductase [Bacillus sp. T33-2]PLR96769.1 glycerol-3-phosphate dehydrogenase [Bacillus sp. T33-2]